MAAVVLLAAPIVAGYQRRSPLILLILGVVFLLNHVISKWFAWRVAVTDGSVKQKIVVSIIFTYPVFCVLVTILFFIGFALSFVSYSGVSFSAFSGGDLYLVAPFLFITSAIGIYLNVFDGPVEDSASIQRVDNKSDAESRIYQPLPFYESKEEIEQVVSRGSTEEKAVLSFAVGQNFPDWKYAQDVCLRLAEDEAQVVRVNACMGLAYIARTKGRLEKHRVKPVLLRELRQSDRFRGSVLDAIEMVNFYMNWRIASKHFKK
ncbi:MAG: hypothetical protein KDD69_09800 [Bdellovibrionales bacterium]|nr:hypothetical protein [Bdellovibrionales bacterium]